MRKRNGIIEFIGDLLANLKSRNSQIGTEAAIDNMDLLRWKAERLQNVGFNQSKGNLFEYIETAKLQRNMGNHAGTLFDRSPLTDAPLHKGGWGEHTAPDDFRYFRSGKVIGRGQAKNNYNPHKAALNFTNPKYKGMQRIAPLDQVQQIKEQLDKMVAKGEISKSAYNDVVKNLQYNGATDPITGINSGGTTTGEINELCGEDGKVSLEAVRNYANRFEFRQYGHEIVTTARNGAAAGAILGGLVSSIQNVYAVLSDRKELDKAAKDIGIDMLQSGVKGGSIGGLGALLRIFGVKNKIRVLNDSTASIVLAGGVVDCGVATYSYVKGETTGRELQEELVDTSIKSATTVFVMKGLSLALGKVNPCIPIVIYAVASQLVTSARTIIDNARLNAEEYNRAAALLRESVELMKKYHRRMNQYLSECDERQRKSFSTLLNGFSFDPVTGEGYEETVEAITKFARMTGIKLQHTDFSGFCSAMTSNKPFILS